MVNIKGRPEQRRQSFLKSQTSRRFWFWAGIILVGLLLLDRIGALIAEGYWFQEVDYLQAFSTRLVTQLGLGLFAFVGSFGLLLGNQLFAHQHSWGRSLPAASTLRRYPTFGSMRLWKLLLLVAVLGISIGIMLIYHGQIAISHWHPQLSVYQYQSPSPVPIKFHPSVFLEMAALFQRLPSLVVGIIAFVTLLLIYPQAMLMAIALLMAVGFGVVMSEQWARLLFFLNPTDFGQTDPLFNQDIGFYVFQLPIWELLAFWLVGLFSLALVSVALLYLLSGDSLSQGKFVGFSAAQLRHLYGLGGCLFFAAALSYWLDRYDLLYSPTGVVYGASYTNVNAELPAYTVLSLLALIGGLLLLWRSFSSSHPAALSTPTPPLTPEPPDISSDISSQADSDASFSLADPPAKPRPLWIDVEPENKATPHRARWMPWKSKLQTQPTLNPGKSGSQSAVSHDKASHDRASQSATAARTGRSRLSHPPNRQRLSSRDPNGSPQPQPGSAYLVGLFPQVVVYGVLGYVAIALCGSVVVPFFVQRTIVQPNELMRETPFIKHSIALTREAFDIAPIEVETFDPQTDLTYEDIQENELTINNVRLWDTRPLLETNRQLQRIRLYYEFPDADVDRYTITDLDGASQRRQVLISARELDYRALPDEAKTWVNEHLIYTHGYGFTMSPVNTVDEGGLPDYFIRGIEHLPSSEAIRRSIPVGFPRIYFGELTDTYVMTQTRVRELDYPSGSENAYTSYDGAGGIGIGDYLKRMLFARHMNDWRMLLSVDFTPDSRLLFRRNIRDRTQAIAPFLRYDSDPYLVVTDITQDEDAAAATTDSASSHTLRTRPTEAPPNYLYWVIDSYTTTSSYPYSDPLGNDFNYIRNSVKVVIDAYNGTTVFYVADENDPIIQSWSKIFPGMFQPLEAMPASLRDHIRYPRDYYQVQSDHLMTYHMTDPQVFYNREDEWRAPREIYANEQQVVEPYYLIMKLPTTASEEFILLRPFTPAQRRNMIAWLAARSDGDRYGTRLLYTFPKQELVFGPEQIEARINQDPVISQQISLWNREGSRAVQGNLLVIPIEQSLLYVEPLYLEAEQDQLPTLVRVIVAFENQIAMAPSLEQALDAIFRTEEVDNAEAQPTILRSVEDLTLPELEGVTPLVPSEDETNEDDIDNETLDETTE